MQDKILVRRIKIGITFLIVLLLVATSVPSIRIITDTSDTTDGVVTFYGDFDFKENSSSPSLNQTKINANASLRKLSFMMNWNNTVLDMNRTLGFGNKWNNTALKTNRSIGFGTTWNNTVTKSNRSLSQWALTWNRTIGFGLKWNSSVVKGNRTAGFGNKWNLTTIQNNKSMGWWAGWNASSAGNFAPNVTFVYNSRGNKYPATAEGVRAAVWNFNGTSTHGGTVWVPPGFYSFPSNFTFMNDLTIIGSGSGGRYDTVQGTCLNLSGTASIIVNYSKLWNLRINAIVGWTGHYALYMDGYKYLWDQEKVLDNVNVEYLGASPGIGTGIEFDAIATVSHQETYALCHFGSIGAKNFRTGIKIYSEFNHPGSAYINGNNFDSIMLDKNVYGMNLTNNGNGTGLNLFSMVQVQPNSDYTSKRAITIGPNANGNTFNSLVIWDNQYWTDNKNVMCIQGDQNVFRGGRTGYDLERDSNASRFNITGAGNTFDMQPTESHVYTIYPTGYRDGTYINTTLSDAGYTSYNKIIFMPGVYDMNDRVARTNIRIDFEFYPGAIFKVNATTWSGSNYVLGIGLGDRVYGNGVIEGNKKVVYGIRPFANNITIEGLTIKNTTSNGIYISGNSRILVDNCFFYSTGNYGVRMLSSNNVTVSNCKFSKVSSTSVCMSDAKDCKVINNIFDGNTSDCVAVTGTGGSRRNLVQGNTFFNADDGVVCSASSNNTIIGNTFFHISNRGVVLSATDRDYTISLNNFNCTTPISNNGVRTLISNNIGYSTFFDIINRTYAKPGYAWFNSSLNRLFVKRTSSTWATFYANQTSGAMGDFAPNVTFIVNSRGNKWSVSLGNLQLAIWDLNTTAGGWVEMPPCNITITNTTGSLRIPSNVWLRGAGNSSVIYLTTLSNRTMIINQDTTNGNKNIRLSDFVIDGNGLHQHEWWHLNTDASSYANAIYLDKCNNVSIKDLTIRNTAHGGIFIVRGADNVIENVKCFDIGSLYKYSGNEYDAWFSCGVWFRNVSRSTISHMIVNDVYSCGIILESHDYAQERNYDRNIVVSDCIVMNASFGFYSERAKDCVYQGCIAINCSDPQIYGLFTAGFRTYVTKRIMITGCKAIDCRFGFDVSGNGDQITGCSAFRSKEANYYIKGNNQSVKDSTSYNATGRGYQIEGTNQSVISCSSFFDGTYGITYNTGSPSKTRNRGSIIQGCKVTGPTLDAINADCYNLSITGNTFIQPGSDGLELTGNNLVIEGNRFSKCVTRSIYLNGCKESMVSDNYIYGGSSGGAAIILSNAHDVEVIGNFIEQAVSDYPEIGIQESGSANHNTIMLNKVNLTAVPATNIIRLGSQTIVRNNYGFTTEASGTFTITVDTNRAYVITNMSCLPNTVLITPYGNTTCTNGNEGFNATYWKFGTSYYVRVMTKGKVVAACTFAWFVSNTTGTIRHNP